jgi:hypothetical protein
MESKTVGHDSLLSAALSLDSMLRRSKLFPLLGKVWTFYIASRKNRSKLITIEVRCLINNARKNSY